MCIFLAKYHVHWPTNSFKISPKFPNISQNVPFLAKWLGKYREIWSKLADFGQKSVYFDEILGKWTLFGRFQWIFAKIACFWPKMLIFLGSFSRYYTRVKKTNACVISEIRSLFWRTRGVPVSELRPIYTTVPLKEKKARFTCPITCK